jgi:hypothetical protein
LIFFPSPGQDVPVTVELIKRMPFSEASHRKTKPPRALSQLSIRATEDVSALPADLDDADEEV